MLGRNGAGKSTLLGMIAGTVRPTAARSAATARSPGRSASRGSFHPDLTGAQNVRFVARIYGMDTDALVAYVEDFAELGEFMDMPVRSYSSGMRARLAFGMSMGIAFDWYLVDEITAVGDTRFRNKSLAAFKTRLKDAGLLMVRIPPTPSAATAPAAWCSSAAGPILRGRRGRHRAARGEHGRLSRRPAGQAEASTRRTSGSYPASAAGRSVRNRAALARAARDRSPRAPGRGAPRHDRGGRAGRSPRRSGRRSSGRWNGAWPARSAGCRLPAPASASISAASAAAAAAVSPASSRAPTCASR